MRSRSQCEVRRAIRFDESRSNLIALALAYLDLKNYRMAYRVLSRSVDLKRTETADIPALMRGLLSLGTVSARLGKHREALKHFRQRLELLPTAEDNVTATQIQYELAALYRSMGEEDLASHSFRTAERMARSAPLWTKDRYRMKQIKELKALFRSEHP